MLTILHEEFAPLTFQIGYLKCPLLKAQEEFARWKRQHLRSLEVRAIDSPLAHSLRELEPLTSIPTRWLFVSTTNDWVAVFDNGVRGPDPVPIVSYLCQKLGCQGVAVSSIPHTLNTEIGSETGCYGAVQFQMFSARPTGFLNFERAVGVVFDGGKWRFDVSGTAQPFEELASYQKRQIRERFTHEMLKRYCHALAIRADSPDYYQPESILFSSRDEPPAGGLSLKLAAARQRIGLKAEAEAL